MELFKEIVVPVLWFLLLGGGMGLLLALASKVFYVKKNERIEQIEEHLPGANCGACGFSGCGALAQAIAKGKAPISSCSVADKNQIAQISKIMGVEVGNVTRMRAQVMCSGTVEFAKKKYIYEGASDCIAAARLGGGDKLCPNGCIGLGTCVKSCPFGAISVENGVAAVDYSKCAGCGVCVAACPKQIIRLIPYESFHWVGCMSVENGKATRKYCDVGCIACRICEKNCPRQAVAIDRFVAAIDYSKCTGCDICIEKCPRKIIWSAHVQKKEGLVITRIDKIASDL